MNNNQLIEVLEAFTHKTMTMSQNIENLKFDVSQMNSKTFETPAEKKFKAIQSKKKHELTLKEQELVASLPDYAHILTKFFNDTNTARNRSFGEYIKDPDVKWFDTSFTKSLNLSDGIFGGFGVAEMLNTDVIRRARDNAVGVLSAVEHRPMGRNYRNVITTNSPTVAKGYENINHLDLPETESEQFGEVHGNIGKFYSKIDITEEAFYDNKNPLSIDLVQSHLDDLARITREYMELQLLFGNGQDDAMGKSVKGILSTHRLDYSAGGQSFKPTYKADRTDPDDSVRGLDFYPAKSTGVNGAIPEDETIIDFFIELLEMVPSQYRHAKENNCAFYMSDATLSKLRKIKSTVSEVILFDDFVLNTQQPTIFGFPVVVCDYIPTPDGSTENPFCIFGSLYDAMALDTESSKLVSKNVFDWVSVDGVCQARISKEIVSVMKANNAIAIGVSSNNTN